VSKFRRRPKHNRDWGSTLIVGLAHFARANCRARLKLRFFQSCRAALFLRFPVLSRLVLRCACDGAMLLLSSSAADDGCLLGPATISATTVVLEKEAASPAARRSASRRTREFCWRRSRAVCGTKVISEPARVRRSSLDERYDIQGSQAELLLRTSGKRTSLYSNQFRRGKPEAPCHCD